MDEQQFLFDERFLEKYTVNKLLNDPAVAVIELIANAWNTAANPL